MKPNCSALSHLSQETKPPSQFFSMLKQGGVCLLAPSHQSATPEEEISKANAFEGLSVKTRLVEEYAHKELAEAARCMDIFSSPSNGQAGSDCCFVRLDENPLHDNSEVETARDFMTAVFYSDECVCVQQNDDCPIITTDDDVEDFRRVSPVHASLRTAVEFHNNYHQAEDGTIERLTAAQWDSYGRAVLCRNVEKALNYTRPLSRSLCPK